VKHGEHLLAVSTDEKIFFCGEETPKRSSLLHYGCFFGICADKYGKKTYFFSDSHAKNRESEAK
jgi:hypothetical protein